MEWATFHGSAVKEEKTFRLTGSGDDGVLSLPIDAVQLEHGKISVKIGALAQIIHEPKGSRDILGFEPREGCKSTCAIGLVEICCDDGRIVGACRIRS